MFIETAALHVQGSSIGPADYITYHIMEGTIILATEYC